MNLLLLPPPPIFTLYLRFCFTLYLSSCPDHLCLESCAYFDPVVKRGSRKRWRESWKLLKWQQPEVLLPLMGSLELVTFLMRNVL